MKKYRININKVLLDNAEIEAKNLKDAKEKIRELIKNKFEIEDENENIYDIEINEIDDEVKENNLENTTLFEQFIEYIIYKIEEDMFNKLEENEEIYDKEYIEESE